MKLHQHLFGDGKPLRCNAWAKPRRCAYMCIYICFYSYIYIYTYICIRPYISAKFICMCAFTVYSGEDMFNVLSQDVNACAVSPDGHVLATGSDDYCFATWDRTSRQCVA